MKTADEFAADYSRRAGVSLDVLRGLGREPRPCACDWPSCQGWIMTHAETYDEDLAAFQRGEGPDPSHGAVETR